MAQPEQTTSGENARSDRRQTFAFLRLTIGLSCCGCCSLAPPENSLPNADIRVTWKYGADLPTPNGSHLAGRLGEDILLAGGTNWEPGYKQWLKEVYIYHPTANTWAYIRDLPRPVANAAVASNSGAVYVCGGADGNEGLRDCLKLSKTGDRISIKKLASLPEPRAYGGGGFLKHHMYVIAGAPDPNNLRNLSSSVFALATEKENAGWRTLAPLPGQPRCVFASTATDEALFVFGGCWFDSENNYWNLPDAYKYSVEDNHWRRIADLPLEMRGACAMPLDNRYIVILGGNTTISVQENKDPAYGFQDTAMIYDTVADRYFSITPMPLKVMVGQLIVMEDKLYYLGGEDLAKHRSDRLLIGLVQRQR